MATVWVHSAKLRVDGITKYLDHNSFRFDYSYAEDSSTEQIYQQSTMPLIDFICAGKGGRATVFAYGRKFSFIHKYTVFIDLLYIDSHFS